MKILDIYKKPLYTLYQWDVNQYVNIVGINPDKPVSVQFWRAGQTEAFVVESTVSGNVVTAAIPNELLREPGELVIYIWQDTGVGEQKGGRTETYFNIPIKERAQPGNYIYDDNNVELITIGTIIDIKNTINNLINRLEKIEKEIFKVNIALNCEASASASETTSLTPKKAVDGVHTTDASRWSSGVTMKNNPVEPQWLQLDLKNDVTDITEIKIYFHAKVWATKYQIQTRASVDDEWKVVKDISNEASDEKNKIDIFTDIAELNRFVRFYFEELNPNAEWGAVSVREIEIYQYTKEE